MNSTIQQTLLTHLAQTQAHYGTHAAFEWADRAIRSQKSTDADDELRWPPRIRPIDQKAIETVAKAVHQLGPDARLSLAGKFAYDHNIHRSVRGIDETVSLAQLNDFSFSSIPFDSALLRYAVARSLEAAVRRMSEDKRPLYLQAGAVFVYSAVRNFLSEAASPKEIFREEAWEAAGDAILDGLWLVNSADDAVMEEKIVKSPIPPSVRVIHHLGLKALEAAEGVHVEKVNYGHEKWPGSVIRLVEIKAKILELEESIRQRDEKGVPFSYVDLRLQVDRLFHIPPHPSTAP